ncbi:MAG: hypothetical protein ABF420_11020 [Acetobacter syzygii]|uniref:hypothetical protein n=1 Tax=Acetobacter syzygii TaxID=146476 RepID=UPI0039EB0342
MFAVALVLPAGVRAVARLAGLSALAVFLGVVGCGAGWGGAGYLRGLGGMWGLIVNGAGSRIFPAGAGLRNIVSLRYRS